MTRRLVCLHGHFYQPPRENPWLEEIEIQDSAAPFHDWNARIAAECYGPNGAARLKNAQGRIVDIVNNYRWLSFNFGPTLLAWLEREAPDGYRRILEADADSVRERGHGNALAQGYNHAILPLCSPRDRLTQVRWGIADFKKRFGRDPEGFWCPETAVDSDTLRALVDEGIRFTILSPFQCAAVRAPGAAWADATGARFDPTRPYKVELGGGRSLALLFYDGPIARSLAFGEGLTSGDDFVQRVESGFDGGRGHDEILSVAVDGETFGHHKKGGDEVLAAGLRALHARPDLELVNAAQALAACPPEWEARVVENSSWSCEHGVERWRSDCGCSGNGQPGWKQHWRAPLRNALDELRGQLAHAFETEGGKVLASPWEARDAFIELVLDPERAGADAFLDAHAAHPLSEAERVTALRLLEMQRQAMLMYTSCGWFFAELSGLETVQVLKYAARAIQLALDATGTDLEPLLRDALARAPTNLAEFESGAVIYDRLVKPSVVSLEGVAAHHAIAGVLEDWERSGRIFCYRYELRARRREGAGIATLAVAHVVLSSLVTRERLDLTSGVLHLGGSDFRCGLRPFTSAGEHAKLERELFAELDRVSLAQVVRELDQRFVGRDYTLRDLFSDERREVATRLLRDTLARYESDYLQIFEANRRLMEFLREISSPVPLTLRVAADVGLTHELKRVARAVVDGRAELSVAHRELAQLDALAQRLGAKPSLDEVRPLIAKLVAARLGSLYEGARGAALELGELVDLSDRLGLHLDFWHSQNGLWDWLGSGRCALDEDVVASLARRLYFDPAVILARARAARPREVDERHANGDAAPAIH